MISRNSPDASVLRFARKSCVLKLAIDAPVTIREDEAAIIEAAFREGYIKPRTYPRNGKKVAVVGSGPAGMAAANQLNRMGYEVTVFEKDEYVGGLLRFGIPNFKLNKAIIDRRVDIMAAEGITFKTSTPIDVEHLPEGFDAYCICTGTPQARDLDIPGRDLKGIHFALETLAQQNRVLGGQAFSKEERINAKGKHVLVIGGGDTGSDCIGTSNRQGAASITQIEIMPKPPVGHNPATPWPQWPVVLKTSSSHEEGCTRRWSLTSNRFIGTKDGRVCGVEVEEVEWIPQPGRRPPRHAPYREKGNPQGRPRAVGHGIPQTPTAGVRKQRFRGRRRGHRCQPRSPLHRRRTQSSPRHQRLLN